MDIGSLIALVFFVVPGFVADKVFVVCWNVAGPATDYERTIRYLLWSVFGLAVYAAIAGVPPSYLPQSADKFGKATFGASTLPGLGIHTLFAVGVAFMAGLLLRVAHAGFRAAFGRSLLHARSWDMLFRFHRTGRALNWCWYIPWSWRREHRRVTVILKDTTTIYNGTLLAAGHSAADRDIALQAEITKGDPDDETDVPLVETKFLLIPADQIREVRFWPVHGERNEPKPPALLAGTDAANHVKKRPTT